MLRNTYAAVNTKTLCENVKNIVSEYGEYKYFFGVIKGNAYGHGFEIIDSLINGGVNYLAVATPEEALSVRKINADIPVLCLEPVSDEGIKALADANITLAVCDLEGAEKVASLNAAVKVHLKLDTGMNRLGFKDKAELGSAYRILKAAKNVTVEGIFTHLATSGINDVYYDRQMARFLHLTEDINLSDIPIVHVGRSLILVHHKKPDFVNGVRLGICMYGFAQSINEPTGLRKIKRNLKLKRLSISPAVLKNDLKLKTALVFKSEVIAVKKIKKGEFAGYGATFIAKSDLTAATVSAGYFDGIPKNIKSVYINGSLCPVIGEICMDMITCIVPDTTKTGDAVEIFGEHISIASAARDAGTNAYKLLTGIGPRVTRIYEKE